MLPKTFEMKLVRIDIYGNKLEVDFKVIIEGIDPKYSDCKTKSNVVKQPFALDHI